MATFGDIPEFTESLASDLFMMRQGSADVSILRKNIFDIAYPVGTVMIYSTSVDPNNIGMPGTWQRVSTTDDGLLATATALAGDIGTFTGVGDVAVPLPPEHTHTASMTSEPDHTHNWSRPVTALVSNITLPVDSPAEVGFVDSIANTTTEPDHTHTTNIGSSGTPSSTIDVRGQRKNVNVWARIS